MSGKQWSASSLSNVSSQSLRKMYDFYTEMSEESLKDLESLNTEENLGLQDLIEEIRQKLQTTKEHSEYVFNLETLSRSKPKPPISAYRIFFRELYREMVQQNPQIKPKQAIRQGTERWWRMSHKERRYYRMKFQEQRYAYYTDCKRFQQRKNEYQAVYRQINSETDCDQRYQHPMPSRETLKAYTSDFKDHDYHKKMTCPEKVESQLPEIPEISSMSDSMSEQHSEQSAVNTQRNQQ